MDSFAPLIAGFSGGVASTTLLLPLDVIKVRLQVYEGHQRLGALRALRGILRYEGLRGLYVGWTPAVVGSAVSWGGYFYVYEGLKHQALAYKYGHERNDSKSNSSGDRKKERRKERPTVEIRIGVASPDTVR